jgi:hypothetical protein
VEFEASGIVDRDGEPVAGAHIALTRCDLEGPDGCEVEKTMAMAMTGGDPRDRARKGQFEIEPECAERLEVEHNFHLGP